MTVHSRVVSDALTTRQLYVERAKTALHGERAEVSSATLIALLTSLGSLTVSRIGQLSKGQLRVFIKSVLEKHDLAATAYRERLITWMQDYVEAEAQYYTHVMNNALDEDDVETSAVWPYVSGVIIGATGETISQTLRSLNTTQRRKIIQTIQRAYAQNWTIAQTTVAFRGTVARGFRDGLLPKLVNAAAATVDTVVQAGMSASRLGALQGFMDYVLGYTWISVLDSRTSGTCRSLSGQVFKFGLGPIPPLHYRCRSHVEPIFKTSARLRQGVASAVTVGETYYRWLARQPASLQDEVLGTTRGKLFRNGGLTTDEFAKATINSRYEPLTLDELRRKSPTTFARAAA